ncbi:MAG: DUF87 domain-containing protein [candidate division Zixibacteria bacterium]|nr:DUF87 domain-containing protein [candidate division Zixibacteria bacterium]
MAENTNYKGIIIGKSITEIIVRTSPGNHLLMGEILVSGGDDIRYFLRVVDISYGFEPGDTGWALNIAGNLMKMDFAERGGEIFDRGKRSFELGRCVILGYTCNGHFKRAKSLPPLFSRVSIPEPGDFQFIEDYAGDLSVGKLRSGEETLELNVGMGKRYIPSHVGIFATTGMGKSNLMKTLSAAVMESDDTGLLIFDPHGEYIDGGDQTKKGLIDHALAKDRLTVYSYRDLSIRCNKLRLSPSEIDTEDLLHLFDFSQAQMEAAYALRRAYNVNWLRELDSRELEDIVEDLPSTKFHEMTIAVLQRRANQILNQPIFHRDQSVSVTRNIISELKNGKVVLIDLSGLSGWRELLPAAVISRMVFESYRADFSSAEKFKALPNIAIVLEEAQRVLGQLSGSKDNVFARICREGRKFKVGLTAITQQPKLINEEILSQFNTLFILGLADERDRNILRASSRQDISELSREIQMLQPGEALISSPQTPFAIPAKIELYEEHLRTYHPPKSPKREKIPPDENFF